MKGYGLPRHPGIEWPDVADIIEYGRKTSIGRVYGSKTAQHSYTRNAQARNTIRRYWKKRERLIQKHNLTIDIEENEDD